MINNCFMLIFSIMDKPHTPSADLASKIDEMKKKLEQIQEHLIKTKQWVI